MALIKNNQSIGLIAIVLLTLMLSSCGATRVVVGSVYPSPLTNTMPLNAGVVYDEGFSDYVYSYGEKSKVSIALGDAQTALYTQAISSMFSEITPFGSLEESVLSNSDLSIVPSVEDVQIALPRDTQLKIYEVWIKFNIQVFDHQGQAIADWIMTSYGKTMDRFLDSKAEAINQAAIVSLRDAGAQLVIKLKVVPGLKEWLGEQMALKRVQSSGKVLSDLASTEEDES